MKRLRLSTLLAFLFVSTHAEAGFPEVPVEGGPADIEIEEVKPFDYTEIFHAARCELFIDICDWSWTRHQCECGIYEPTGSDG